MLRAPLVGTRFRRAGELLLASLPAGCTLHLAPEPTNPVDGKAIKVLVDASDIPREAHAHLRESLPNFGLTLEQWLEASEMLPLGYIASSTSEAGLKALAGNEGSVGNADVLKLLSECEGAEVFARLSFAMSGLPEVIITTEQEEQESDLEEEDFEEEEDSLDEDSAA